jgi:hypothetical protein
MRLVQYREPGGHRAVAVMDRAPPSEARRVQDAENTYELALEALETGKSLAETVRLHGTDAAIDLDKVGREGRLLAPIEHPVPTRCWITGSEIGPGDGQVPPGWFFRGNGATLVGSGQPLQQPDFGMGAAARASVVGLYIIADDGTPCRLGWALGNDFTDDRVLGLGPAYRAPARLRASAVGPELVFGDLPREITGSVRLRRGSELVEEVSFAMGQAALGQSLAALEANHFRYPMFRRPGDVHFHFLAGGDGASLATAAQAGDVFEIAAPDFGRPLVSPLAAVNWAAPKVRVL